MRLNFLALYYSTQDITLQDQSPDEIMARFNAAEKRAQQNKMPPEIKFESTTDFLAKARESIQKLDDEPFQGMDREWVDALRRQEGEMIEQELEKVEYMVLNLEKVDFSKLWKQERARIAQASMRRDTSIPFEFAAAMRSVGMNICNQAQDILAIYYWQTWGRNDGFHAPGNYRKAIEAPGAVEKMVDKSCLLVLLAPLSVVASVIYVICY